VLLALLLLIIGLVAGLARGGRIENITRVHFRQSWLVFLGLALQVGAEVTAHVDLRIIRGPAGSVILGVSYGLVLAFVALNVRFPGTILMGAGLLLNLTVILANNGMPVSARAAREAGIHSLPRLQTEAKHHLMGRRTRLAFLGDVIPLPLVGVVSAGDIVLGAGICLLIDRLVASQPGGPSHRGAPAPKRRDPPAAAPDPSGPGHRNHLPSNK